MCASKTSRTASGTRGRQQEAKDKKGPPVRQPLRGSTGKLEGLIVDCERGKHNPSVHVDEDYGHGRAVSVESDCDRVESFVHKSDHIIHCLILQHVPKLD